MYAEVKPGPLKIEPWLASIKAGRTFATNGPLLHFSLGGQGIGGEVQLGKNQKQEVRFQGRDEFDCPGRSSSDCLQWKSRARIGDGCQSYFRCSEGSIPLEGSGWCVLRAFSDKAEYPILDLYPYATTSPVYVSVAGAPLQSAADAAYFVAWMDRLIAAAESNTSWNTEAEKESVL